jgi:hypothetical protein
VQLSRRGRDEGVSFPAAIRSRVYVVWLTYVGG